MTRSKSLWVRSSMNLGMTGEIRRLTFGAMLRSLTLSGCRTATVAYSLALMENVR